MEYAILPGLAWCKLQNVKNEFMRLPIPKPEKDCSFVVWFLLVIRRNPREVVR